MNKWQIKDLKGVGDVELNLDSNQRVFTLLGTNGVGKTNILLSLLCFLLVNTRDFSLYVNVPINRISNSLIANMVSLNNVEMILDSIFVNDGMFYSTIIYDSRFINEYSIIKVNIDKINGYETVVYIPTGLKKISKNSITEVQIQDLNSDNREKLYNKFLEYTFFCDEHDDDKEMNVRYWFIKMTLLSNPYHTKANIAQNAISAILTSLNAIDDRIDDKFLAILGSDVFIKIDGQKREISTLSSGFLYIFRLVQKIISSYALLEKDDIFNIKGVVLIDEIESHLHLEWQVKIIPILKNLFPNTTFYITTHSPLVLSQLNEGEAYLLKRDEDNVVRSHLINSPNTRLLENVLQDAFGVNLNELKRQNMVNIDQSKAKKKLLDLLNSQVSQ